jgi:aerobic-type carbon monoxide dehydrogenase small subunit (CoxS/CutS family)
MMQAITIEVNGEKYSIEVRAKMTLTELLRDRLHLTGTKESCGTGDCGACTVIMNGQAINSCLVLAVEADGCRVTTVEGLSKGGQMHPLQEEFINVGAVQCGFCTPGMLMAAKALLDRNSDPTIEEIKQALAGNLCRCTGYVKIITAVQSAGRKMRGSNNGERAGKTAAAAG